MKPFLVLSIIVLSVLSSGCTTSALRQPVTRTLPSGNVVRVLQIGPMIYTSGNKEKTLALSYLTDKSLDEKDGLAREVGEIWVAFRPEVEKGGFDSAVVFAEEPSKDTGFVKQSRKQGFVFVKDTDGAWTCNDNKSIVAADQLYRETFSALEKGQYSEAIQRLDGLIKLWPRSAEAYGNRGICHMSLNNTKDALADMDKAISLDPTVAMAYNNRGGVYGRLGNLEKAHADFNKALELNPQLALAYMNRGEIYVKQNKGADAVKDLSMAIKLNPKLGEAFFYRAQAYKKLGKLQESKEDTAMAKELNYNEEIPTVTIEK